MNLGPVVLSVDEIKTGLATILIVFIPNIIVILLFKYAGPKKNPYERNFDVNEEEDDTGDFFVHIYPPHVVFSSIYMPQKFFL